MQISEKIALVAGVAKEYPPAASGLVLTPYELHQFSPDLIPSGGLTVKFNHGFGFVGQAFDIAEIDATILDLAPRSMEFLATDEDCELVVTSTGQTGTRPKTEGLI